MGAPVPEKSRLKAQVFTASTSFTVPPGVHQIFVTLIGGGGGGSIGAAAGGNGGNGGNSTIIYPGGALAFVLWRHTSKQPAALTASGIARYGSTDYQVYQEAGF